MAVQNARGAPSSSYAVVEALITRITAKLTAVTKPAGFLRVSVFNEDAEAAYKSEEGLHLLVDAPRAQVSTGAGRAGERVVRRVIVRVVTRSNADRAGDNRIGLQRHMNLEDLVIEAAQDVVPDGQGSGTQTAVGFMCRLSSEASPPTKRPRVAPDVFVSEIPFEIRYVQPLLVDRT